MNEPTTAADVAAAAREAADYASPPMLEQLEALGDRLAPSEAPPEDQRLAVVEAAAAPRPSPLELELRFLGNAFAHSGMFKDAQRASQAIVKILAGRELGLSPIASMMGIYVIEGKISLSGNAMATVIKRSKRYAYHVRELTHTVCKIDFCEGTDLLGVSVFTIEDATRAGLVNKPIWKAYPRNMLFNRAISNGARWYTPNLFGGPTYTPEELGRDEIMTSDGSSVPEPLDEEPL